MFIILWGRVGNTKGLVKCLGSGWTDLDYGPVSTICSETAGKSPVSVRTLSNKPQRWTWTILKKKRESNAVELAGIQQG